MILVGIDIGKNQHTFSIIDKGTGEILLNPWIKIISTIIFTKEACFYTIYTTFSAPSSRLRGRGVDVRVIALFYRIGNCVPIRQKNDLIALAIFSCLRHENANGHEQSDITSSYRPIQI